MFDSLYKPTANDLHKGEYPACAALTSGYVFRIENPATVHFLQRVGRTSCLTSLEVSTKASSSRFLPIRGKVLASLGHYAAAVCSILAAQRLYVLDDAWGLFFISNLALIRLINFAVLRHHSQPGWFGAPEPGIQGDLFIILSQDRWLRIHGLVDDLKALTSETWLSEPTTLESSFNAIAKVLIYANVAVAGHTTDAGVYTITSMLLVNSGPLALDNLRVSKLKMYERTMKFVSGPKRYSRRRDLAEQLIKESGRDDWAVAIGLIVKDKASTEKKEGVSVIM
ncbi:hypothetical protein N0V90_007804 [Kalmusia sp. IMI 367209]|nr:hypothetical protein N0V90_007804 [Kalmusia sp. IMI 367209]